MQKEREVGKKTDKGRKVPKEGKGPTRGWGEEEKNKEILITEIIKYLLRQGSVEEISPHCQEIIYSLCVVLELSWLLHSDT